MLDIKVLRSDSAGVKERLRKRLADESAVDSVLAADTELRSVKAQVETLRADLRVCSASIPGFMKAGDKESADSAKSRGREIGDQISLLDEQERTLQSRVDDLLFYIPNLPHDDTPEGPEENFKIVSEWGVPRAETGLKPHWDIAADFNLIDLARGAKLSGSGFVLYRGLGALLERALIQFMLDLHIQRHGYTEWATPYFLSQESMRASTHLAKFKPEMYHDDVDDLYAIPTAEPALVNIHRDEILDGRDLPLRYVAHSPCWRREAGAAGKDTRGLLRVHQFNKVEMVKITTPESSYDEMESLLKDATDVLEALGLPYRVKLLAAGDLSFAATKCYDVETYAPGVGAWLEVSSCSNCEDIQSRQANIRFRREPGAKPEFPHMLNCSGTALPRVMATLLEHYQQPDGSVAVPEGLQPYLGGRTSLSAGG